MIHYGLEGKTAIVTGSARGMGKATALALAGHGANVVVCDLMEDAVKQTAVEVEAKGVQSLAIPIDVSDYTAIENAVTAAIGKFGKVDFLINCVGICPTAPLVDMEEKTWDKVLDINLKSVYAFARFCAKNMIENGTKGRIITISSQASKIGEANISAYSASKAGINAFTQSTALELAPHGITVNAICPGYVYTEMVKEITFTRSAVEGGTPEEYYQKLCNRIPLGRMAMPEEVGQFMSFLCSEHAGYITGIAITYAGGTTLI